MLDDFDRPLAPRGEKAAPRMGAFIMERGLVPDLILCSGSARTRQTLALVAANWPSKPDILYEDAFYHATAPVHFAQLHAAPEAPSHLMMVGHNPGMQAFALLLIGRGKSRDLRNIEAKYPSGALAVITFDKPHWRDIGPGDGELVLFMRPKDLPGGV